MRRPRRLRPRPFRPLASAGLALMLAAAATPPPALAQQAGTVQGRVLEVSSGEPVEGATVRVLGTVLIAVTDAEGSFVLRGLPAGPRRLSVERLGYAPQRVEIEVPAAGVIGLDISLEVRAVAVGAVVVSATKRALGSFDAPLSVSVQETAEIRRHNPATLNDAIAYAPGVQFVGDQLNIRGSSGFARGVGTRVTLLMDGIVINSIDAGILNWDMIPLTEVERVEILKGSDSALYGTSALGGVVNVVMTDAPADPITHLRLRAGFYDNPPAAEWIWSDRTLGYSGVELSHGRQIGSLGVWLRGGLANDDGFAQNSDSERLNLALRLGVGDVDNRFRLFGSWAREDHGETTLWCEAGQCDTRGLQFQPAQVPVSDLDDRTRSDKTLVSASWERSGRVTSTFVRGSWQRNDWRTDFGSSVSGAESNRLGGELRLGWQPIAPLFMTLGGVGDYSDVDSELSGQHDIIDAALYLQLELGLGPLLTFTAGARGDVRWLDGGSFSDPYTEQLSPRFGIVFAPDAVTRVRASGANTSPAVARPFRSTKRR